MTGPYGCPVHEHGQTGQLGDLAACLVSVEAMHHDLGWDNSPPTVHQMHRHPDDAQGDPVYGATVIPLGIDAAPRVELAALARLVANPLNGKALAPLYRHPPVATILVAEAWQRSVPGDVTWEEEMAERAGREIADMLGSVEIRLALAVADDVLLSVQRTRGQVPLFARHDFDTDDDPAWGGAMMDPLRALDHAVRAAYEESVNE